MQYKIYSYELSDKGEKILAPDKHHGIFDKSKGRDDEGRFTRYRGKRDAVLMAIRQFGSDFTGLVGRHATEREITAYDETHDEAHQILEDDNDYPHTAFICFPRLKSIACIDGSVKADAALQRLHMILAHRKEVYFTFEPLKEPIDLRKATKRFKVTEVSFEVLPVNPHTGPLGAALDANRALDHIKKLKGRAEGTRSDPIKLNGGLMSAVQELQQSGHAKVGFRGFTDGGIEVVVPKPKNARELSENEDESVHGEDVDVKVSSPGSNHATPSLKLT